MSKKPVIILHFSPVEMYPPVLNLLNYASRNGTDREWIVITTSMKGGGISNFSARGIRILRKGKSGNKFSRVERILGYVSFYAAACFVIIRKNPGALLCYETLSCLPAYICKSIFGKRSRLFIHHHEYVTPGEYENGSSFFRLLHRKEKEILPLAYWMSQTNQERLRFFLKDMNIPFDSRCRILPNYPPADWRVGLLKDSMPAPLRIVYLGSLSKDTMYLSEFAAWVNKQGGKVCWDIYSFMPDQEILKSLVSSGSPHIRWRGSLTYDSIPSVLRNYDVGVILYKGHIPNYVYNAPNKLFEYHVNGLDVWFPSVMLGSLPFVTKGTYPRIISLDFDNLDAEDPFSLTERTGLIPQIGDYSCEAVLSPLYNELQNN